MIQPPLHYSSEAVSEEYIHINNCSTLKHDVEDARIIRPRGRRDYLLVYIHFTGIGCETLIRKAALKNKRVILPHNPNEPEHYLTRICQEFDNTDDQKNLLCEGLLITVLGLLAASTHQKNSTVPSFSREPGESIGSIRTHASQPYNLEHWAKQCHISKTHFIQTFKAATGFPPYQYLTMVRLKHAKELLLFTDLSVSKIGELCGYPDYNYFSRIFKKYVGMTPTVYRGNKSSSV